MRRIHGPLFAAFASGALLLAGCSGGSGTDADDIGPTDTSSGSLPGGSTVPPSPSGLHPLFQVAQGLLPYPTDLYYSGTTDGTLNISPANSLIPAQAALNSIDGYGVNTPIRARFSGAVNAASLTAASVRVVRVNIDNTTKATVGVAGVLVPGVDYSVGLAPDAGVGNQIVEIRPLRPLVPSTGATNNGYLVLLTNGITDAAGAAAVPDTDYATIKNALAGGAACPSITNATMNGVCRLTGAHLQIAAGVGLNPANVILSFSFSTGSTRDSLAAVAATVTAQAIVVQATGLNTSQVNPALPGVADVYSGVLQIPYYLSKTAPLTGFWQGNPSPVGGTRLLTRFNPVPVATETLSIPLLATVPNAASGRTKPPAGWPVVVFQHGITGNRTNMLGLADSFAAQGFVVVAIDQPLHGITDPMNPLYQQANERTFNMDVMNNATGAAGPDGVIDSSGASFINLSSLLTARDNLREASADLMTLVRSVGNLDVSGDAVADIDATRIHFVGQSLGSIVAIPWLSMPGAVQTATLSVPGGLVTQLLRDSPTFAPRINAGLAAQGLVPGTTLYNQFFRDAQNVIEAGDPINYMAAAAAARPILLHQVIGDTVIPNSATQRLIDIAALPKVGTPGANPVSRAYVNFTAGVHSSLLDPTASLAATVEMQTQAVTFAVTNGTVVAITNPAVVQP
jgi:alpha-beta hydrolase superfamily lysophospholipase